MPSKLELLPQDIEKRLKKLPEKVESFKGLAAFWLFGSFVRGETTPISDIDLAFLFEGSLASDDEKSHHLEEKLYQRIAAALGTDEFALVNLWQAPLYFAHRILLEGQLLVCRHAPMVAEFAEAVYRQAPDVLWLRHTGNRDFLEGISIKMSTPKIDKDRITEFLRLISEQVKNLEEKSKISLQDYLDSRDVQAIVERRCQTATETCINIANHLIARLKLRAPQDYSETFQILGEAGILPERLADQMADLARFRNLLVHLYWDIDHKRVYRSLPSRLATIQAFTQHIGGWLKEIDQDSPQDP